MNKSETALLLGLAAAYDRRTVGEFDVEAWHDVLNDIPFEDAKAAVKNHYKSSSDWVMPAMIRAAVRKIRAERLDKAAPLTPPPDLSPAETVDWLRRTRKAVADGTYVPPVLELKSRDMAAIEGVVTTVEELP